MTMKELAEICEYAFRAGFNAAIDLTGTFNDLDLEEIIDTGIEETRKNFNLQPIKTK